MTVACPRHGVVAVVADTPCPHCQVLTYNLEHRDARDVVRKNRHTFLAGRRAVIAATIALPTIAVSFWRGSAEGGVGIDFVTLFVGAFIAIMGADPIARMLEPKPALRALDAFLKTNKV